MNFTAGDRVAVIRVTEPLPAPFQIADIPPGERGTVVEARITNFTTKTAVQKPITVVGVDPGFPPVYELRVLWDATSAIRSVYSYQVRLLGLVEQIGELEPG